MLNASWANRLKKAVRALGQFDRVIRGYYRRVSEREDESLERDDRLFISKIKKLPSQETEVKKY